MAQLCIPRIQATKLINSLKGDGLEKLSNFKTFTDENGELITASAQRREFLAKHVGKEMSEKVNASFEKAIAAKRKSAMVEFAKKVVGQKDLKEKNVIQRIEKLDDAKLLDGNILEDHISDFLGARITEKEVKIIKELGKKTSEAKKVMDRELKIVMEKGEFTPKYQESLIEYGKALKETDDFLFSQSKTDWSATIWNHAQAVMLLNPASWNVNIVSNLINGGVTAMERRVKNLRFFGYSSDLAKEWKKNALLVRKKTGYDLSRSLSLDELMSKKIMGEKTAVGKDSIFTKLIYEDALGRNDAWSGRMAFADALNLESASMAHGLGLKGKEAREKARELFLDAMNVVPKSKEGIELRQKAVLEAQIATWTQPGLIKEATSRLRNGLDKMVEDGMGIKGFKLGTSIEPFIGTIANIAQYGLDASGVGIVRGSWKLASLLRSKKMLTEYQVKRQLGEALNDAMRTGLGIGGGLALASFIPSENFMGAYDPNRHKYAELKNSTYNAIRIGDKWYSLDYFGGFAMPLIAVLYAKKYGEGNIAKQVGEYFVGAADQAIAGIPFTGSIRDMWGKYNQQIDPNDPDSAGKGLKLAGQVLADQITSRVPGLVINIAKLFDPNEREAKGAVNSFLSKIPGIRNILPTKQDMLGQEILTEMGRADTPNEKFVALLTQILAGARIKTAKDTGYGSEIIRLRESGTPVSLTSWKYRLGERQERLKEKVGEEKYKEIYRDEFGKELIKKMESEISKDSYKKKEDAEKKKILDKLNDQVMDKIYSKYHIPLKK